MKRKEIDLKPFVEEVNDMAILKGIFFNDYDLQRLFALFYNHNPISLPRLTKEWNNIFQRNNDKRFIKSKLDKIERFGLFDKVIVSDCKDEAILEVHKKYLAEIPAQLHKIYNNVVYYYLTEKGIEWIDIVNEQLKKKLKAGKNE